MADFLAELASSLSRLLLRPRTLLPAREVLNDGVSHLIPDFPDRFPRFGMRFALHP